MKKNVASQKVGAQMVSATDGSAFTGSVTVEVTLDAGTQATGSVGSGACTHEGTGYHTYAPAQAETNGDLAAFTFHGTGAIPVTVQIYTSFPQSADNATNIALIKTSTDEIGTAGAGLTNINLPNQTMDIVGNITGNLSGSVGSVGANGISAASLAADAGTELATALLDLANGVETGTTVRQALKILGAALAGKVSGAGTTTITFRNMGDASDVIVATVDADGNRSAVTLTP